MRTAQARHVVIKKHKWFGYHEHGSVLVCTDAFRGTGARGRGGDWEGGMGPDYEGFCMLC